MYTILNQSENTFYNISNDTKNKYEDILSILENLGYVTDNSCKFSLVSKKFDSLKFSFRCGQNPRYVYNGEE